jgi:hypothetical protein
MWGVLLYPPIMHQGGGSSAPSLSVEVCTGTRYRANLIEIETCTSLNSPSFLLNFVIPNLNWYNVIGYLLDSSQIARIVEYQYWRSVPIAETELLIVFPIDWQASPFIELDCQHIRTGTKHVTNSIIRGYDTVACLISSFTNYSDFSNFQ